MSDPAGFIALKCNACGGKLRVPATRVVEQECGAFVIIGGETFACEHCGTQYLAAQQLQGDRGGGGITISGNIVNIGGDIIGGDLVIWPESQDPLPSSDISEPGPRTTAHTFPVAPVKPRMRTRPLDKPRQKKWWQFWK